MQHNTLSLSAAEVNFTKTPTADSRVGFRTDIWFGKAADLTAAYEPASDGKEIYKHVQQAYVSLLTGKVQWDAGKFVTPMGAEVIESQDNWNYSRSISATRSRSTTSACARRTPSTRSGRSARSW